MHSRRTWAKAGLAITALMMGGVGERAAAQTAADVAGLAAYDGADRSEKLAAAAAREGTLTIYTSATVDDMTALTTAFEAKTGIKVKIYRASSEDILRRAVTEYRANRFDVDLFETDQSVLEILAKERLMVPVKSPVRAQLVPEATAPAAWTGTRLQIISAAVNTNLIKPADLPKSYDDFLDPKWKGKLGVEVGDYDWFATVVEGLGEEKGLDLFNKIVATNGISVRSGHTLIANLVASGEVPFALTTYLYKVNQLKNDGAPIAAVALNPAVARVNGVGLAARAPHPNAALAFFDWLLTEGQPVLLKREQFPTNKAYLKLPDGLELKFADPAASTGDRRWERLFKTIVTSKARM